MTMKKETFKFIKCLTNMLAIAISLMASSSWAATYYVDSSAGNDVNNGLSASTPWKTVAKVNASKFLPGDQILFASGRVWREGLVPSSSGTSGNPITFGSYGTGEKPVISGADAPISWSQVSGYVYSAPLAVAPARVWNGNVELMAGSSISLGTNQFYYSAGKLYVNIGKNPSGTAIEANQRTYSLTMNKSYVTIDGLHITMGNKNNIGHTAYTDHCIIQNCLIDKAARMGMYTGQSATVNATNWTIQYCTFADNGRTLTQDHGIYCKWDKNWIIQYNKFLRNKAFGINLNGTSNCIVRYNYSEGNLSGFMELYEDTAGPSNYNQIYYNISNGDRKLLFVGGGSGHTGNVVYNNTVYGFVYAALDIENNAKLAEVRNNIFWSTVTGSKSIAVNAGSSIQYSSNNNLGTGPISYNGAFYSSLDAFRKAYPNLEVNSISADPLFVSAGSNFHLTANSPCINKGVNLSLAADFDGNSFSSGTAPDMGALEYQSTGQALAPPSNLRLM